MKTCRWCGKPFKGMRADAVFDTPLCRRDFNANRAKRGAQLYDLFMVMRFQRGLAVQFGVWAKACLWAWEWRQEDIAKRDGRNSWDDIETVLMRNPHLRTKTLPSTRIGRGA